MIRVLSTMAIMGAMKQAAPAWEARTGTPIQAEYAPTVALLERLRQGERADAVFLTAAGIDEMIQAGVLRAGSRVDVAVSYVGVAVKAGAPKPDIGTVEAFRTALLAARSVAWSRIGASGLFFAELIRRLGIEEPLRAKGLVVSGFTAEKAASGEAELAIQQISELMVVPGIEVVGKLPAEIQAAATFSGGVTDDVAAEATELLRFLASAQAAPMLRRAGLEPVAHDSQ
jgi:molybdate transport system substrate-binding protein